MGNEFDIYSFFGIKEVENPIFNFSKVNDYRKAIEIAQQKFGKKAIVTYDSLDDHIDPHILNIEFRKFNGKCILETKEIGELADVIDISPDPNRKTTNLWFGFDLIDNAPDILDQD